MGERYLIDTNIAIYFLDGFLPESAKYWVLNVLNISSNLSIITKIELLSKPMDKEQENTLEIFLKNSNIYSLDDLIVNKTVEIRRTYKLKLPDALIAGTAITHQLTLVTRNTKDFVRVSELKIINPFEI